MVTRIGSSHSDTELVGKLSIFVSAVKRIVMTEGIKNFLELFGDTVIHISTPLGITLLTIGLR